MSPAVGTVPLWARDTIDDLKSAPQTFSSWDRCMQKSYCKWPVIVAIIIGSLILLSIVACIINCMCCGIQCCKGCCECCSCCCPSPRRRPDRSKYLDDPVYHQPPPPPPPSNSYNPPAPPAYRGAQVARFDSPAPKSPNVNEDALPAMPTWDSAVSRRVEDTGPRDDMEMEPLNPAQHRQPSPRPTPAPTTTYRPGYRGIDDHSSYSPRSPTIPSPAPFSPYDQQPYRDLGNPYQSRTATPATVYSQSVYSQPTYNPMPTPAPPSEMHRYTPFQRQPSPVSIQPSIQPPSYTTQPPYRGMSPAIPTSPPPSFSSTPAAHEVVNDPGRPPSLLQSGRKPVPNSYRDV